MKKKITVLALLMSVLTFSANGVNAAYSDVSESDWCYDEVRYVSEKGIMQGVTDTDFEPESEVTRGMLVSMLHRMDGSPDVKITETFKDVTAGAYYEKPVAWACKNKLVSGYGNENFGPYDTITREQVAVILFRFATYKSFAWTNKGDLSVYSDGEMVSAYARHSVGWADGFGIIKGNDGKINPAGKLTRGEVAVILSRFCNEFMPDFGEEKEEVEEKEKEWHILDISEMSDEEIGKAVDELVRNGIYDIKITPMIHYPAQYVVRDTLRAWCNEDRASREGKVSLYYDKTTYVTSYGLQECYAIGEFYGPDVVKLEQCAFIEARYMTKLYVPLVEQIRGDELWGCVVLTDITAIGW